MGQNLPHKLLKWNRIALKSDKNTSKWALKLQKWAAPPYNFKNWSIHPPEFKEMVHAPPRI